MGVTQYIGARYVPLFADPAEWNNTRTYEPLTIVLHEGNSFTSKQFVPKGIDIDNADYWAETGNYNAQVEQYRQEVLRFSEDIVEKAFAFETVADMKASNSLFNGAICHTNGFYASGDGGAAWYVISNNGTANEMNVVKCGNLFANLVYDSEMHTAQFGATSQISDASSIIQHMINLANNSNKKIIIDTRINIRTSLTIEQDCRISIDSATPFDICINAYTDMFVGSMLSNNSLTNLYINMTNVYIDCKVDDSITIFKGINMLSSNIFNCRFYHFAIFLEGGTNFATRIENCRFQSYYRCVFSSVVFKNSGNKFNFLKVQEEYLNNNKSLANSQIVYNITAKLADELWITKCYISGTQDKSYSGRNNHICVIFSVNDPDRDNTFNYNWIEFVYWFYMPLDPTANAFGFNFINNVVQYCVNLLQPSSTYSNWKINNNRFSSMSETDYTNKLGPVDNDTVFAVIKSTGILNRIILNDNFITGNVDFLIWFEGGNSRQFRVKERNTFYSDYTPQPAKNVFHILYYPGASTAGENTDPFFYSDIESLSNMYYASENDLPDLHEHGQKLYNIFANTKFYTLGNIYFVVPYSGGYKYVTVS